MSRSALEELVDRLEEEPIRFLDVGCNGEFSPIWAPLGPLISYVGCDPLLEEGAAPGPGGDKFLRAHRRAVAVAANPGTASLHVAVDREFSSLLPPNWSRISRFNYAWRFEQEERRDVPCTTLSELARDHGQPDVIKLDSQGLEYQLISSSLAVVREALCLEVETGLIDNYVGEYPYAVIDPVLRAAGFCLVDFQPRHSRRLGWTDGESQHQPLWCEATWLVDVVGQRQLPERAQAHKLLLMCKALRHYAFGQELAQYLRDARILSASLGDLLSDPASWQPTWQLGGLSLT